MPYGNFTLDAIAYEPRQPGVYQKAGLSFADPTHEFRIRPSISPGKDKNRRASVSSVLEYEDATDPSLVGTEICTFNLTASELTSAVNIRAAVVRLAAFLTVERINRILSGEA